MTPYLDAGFLLTLLVRTDGTKTANAALHRFDGPIELNFLHQLQALNLLVQQARSSDVRIQTAAHEGRRLWDYLFAEGVFRLAPVDWNHAFITAATWTEHSTSAPPSPLLLLHAALAVTVRATHFLSFDPRSRAAAKAAGLHILPEKL